VDIGTEEVTSLLAIGVEGLVSRALVYRREDLDDRDQGGASKSSRISGASRKGSIPGKGPAMRAIVFRSPFVPALN
jgi:hypothetical protein